jgi:hypothetical protein
MGSQYDVLKTHLLVQSQWKSGKSGISDLGLKMGFRKSLVKKFRSHLQSKYIAAKV